MGKRLKNPKKHIVSCRVSNMEMEILQRAANQSSLSISEFIRSCLEKPLVTFASER